MYEFNEKKSIINILKAEQEKNVPLFLYGYGWVAQKLEKVFQENGIKISGFFVDDKYYCETPNVFKKTEILKLEYFNTVIAFAYFYCTPYINLSFDKNSEPQNPLQDKILQQKGYVFDCLFNLIGFWNKEIVDNNYMKVQDIYSHLIDKKSEEICDALCKRFWENDINNLIVKRTSPQYFIPEIMTTPFDIFIDCGAYTGDTAIQFAHLNPSYEKIYAFEPDSNNFSKLKENTKKLTIKYFQKGLYFENTKLLFTNTGTPSASFVYDVKKKNSIDVIALDTLQGDFENKRILLKADIEGSELDMLNGAKKFIKKYRPIVAICIYHDKLDLFNLPSTLLSLHSDYKFYMRHHSDNAWDTVLYAV